MPGEVDPRVADVGDGGSGVNSWQVNGNQPRSVADQLGYRRTVLGVLIVTAAVVLGFLAGKASGSGAPAAKMASQVTATQTFVRHVTATQTVIRQVTAPPPTPTPGPFNQLIGTGARCSLQNGHQLQLGDEVSNGLEVRSPWSVCEFPTAPVMNSDRSAAYEAPVARYPALTMTSPVTASLSGASVWLTVTVDVLTGCPTPLHLTILLDYSQNGHTATARLADFPDLGDVPYTGCH